MRKRLSLLLMIIGFLVLGIYPYKALRQNQVQEKYIQSYENKDFGATPIEEIQQTVQRINQGPIQDPFADIMQPLELKVEYALGYIKIPKIGETLPLYIGASNENLSKGVAQITGTALPLSGKGTHTYIAGHRMTTQSNMFLFVDQLVPGDLIFLSYLGQEAVYVVTGNEVIEPTQGEKLLEVDKNQELLSLLTCHPFPTDRLRLLVHSRRLSDEEIKELDKKVQQEKPREKTAEQVQEGVVLFENIVGEPSIKPNVGSQKWVEYWVTVGIENNKLVLFISLVVLAILTFIWLIRLILTFRKR